MRPNIQLLIGEESTSNYIAFKIAELTADETGRLRISERYIPPCLKVGACPGLMQPLEQLVAALGAKQKTLMAQYGNRAAAIVEFGAPDVMAIIYLHTISHWLPILLHYANGGDVHPERLYLALSALAGQLHTFEATTDPATLPRFQHQDLQATFAPLFDLVLKSLGADITAGLKPIPLELTQPGLFEGKLEDPQILRDHMLFLIASGDVAEATLREDLPRYVKIGSIDQIVQIVNSALPGLTISIDLSPPTAIPIKAQNVYFRLDQQGRYWDNIVQSGSIAIYQPVEPERVNLELVAVEV